jgi:hypothetical protein
MRRVTAVLSAAVIALSAVSVLAQAKPDFSGTWTLVPPADGGGGGGGGRGGGRGGGGGGWGMSPTIKQTGSTLVVTYTAGRGGGEAQPVTVTYNIGGAPTKRSMMGRGGEATEVTDTATWSGNSLVIVTKTATAEQRRTISLKDGNLVIEYNSGREGATPQTITYKKG